MSPPIITRTGRVRSNGVQPPPRAFGKREPRQRTALIQTLPLTWNDVFLSAPMALVRLLLLLAGIGVALSVSCEWVDKSPETVNGDSGIYQFKNMMAANGSLWRAFPPGASGILELTFCEPSLGYRVTCTPKGAPQFSADTFSSVVLIHLPPPDAPSDWDLCTYVISSAPLCSAHLSLDPCSVPLVGTSAASTSTAASTTTTGGPGTRRPIARHNGIWAVLTDIPVWLWVLCGSLIGLVLVYLVCACCIYECNDKNLRGRYTPLLDGDETTSLHTPHTLHHSRPPPQSLNESLSTARLLSPFRAFLRLRCGSLLCLVLSTRSSEEPETREHHQASTSLL